MKLSKFLPHELFFGLFLVVTWVRLGLGPGWLDSASIIYLVLIAANAALVAWCLRQPSRVAWYARLLYYVVAMEVVFPHMKTAIPKLGAFRADLFLQQIDHAVIGRNLSLRLEPFVHPVWTELFSLCYFLFFPYLFLGIAYYLFKPLPVFKQFVIGLFTIYGLGFLGYSLLPAAGPYLAMQNQFSVPLQGWFLTRLNVEAVRMGSNQVDVFPSLHCAISAFFLAFDRVHKPWRFRLYLLPCVGLWCSTIYLRYHYLVDVVCGFLLAAFAYWIAVKVGEEKACE